MKHKDDFKKRFGIAVSTARYQLLKNLLFKFLLETGKNSCFRCGETMTSKDFTLEHIKPWAWDNNALELFMDINNISFSHFRCNAGNTRTNSERAKKGHISMRKHTDTHATCSLCGQNKERKEFNKNRSNISGLQSSCKSCRQKLRPDK